MKTYGFEVEFNSEDDCYEITQMSYDCVTIQLSRIEAVMLAEYIKAAEEERSK